MEKLRDSFLAADADDSGAIDEDELAGVLNVLGERVSKARCKAMLHQLDADGDGKVDFYEVLLYADIVRRNAAIAASSRAPGADSRPKSEGLMTKLEKHHRRVSVREGEDGQLRAGTS